VQALMGSNPIFSAVTIWTGIEKSFERLHPLIDKGYRRFHFHRH
jgi:hypothetical protein